MNARYSKQFSRPKLSSTLFTFVIIILSTSASANPGDASPPDGSIDATVTPPDESASTETQADLPLGIRRGTETGFFTRERWLHLRHPARVTFAVPVQMNAVAGVASSGFALNPHIGISVGAHKRVGAFLWLGADAALSSLYARDGNLTVNTTLLGLTLGVRGIAGVHLGGDRFFGVPYLGVRAEVGGGTRHVAAGSDGRVSLAIAHAITAGPGLRSYFGPLFVDADVGLGLRDLTLATQANLAVGFAL